MARSRENEITNYPINDSQLESILSDFGVSYHTNQDLAGIIFLGVSFFWKSASNMSCSMMIVLIV